MKAAVAVAILAGVEGARKHTQQRNCGRAGASAPASLVGGPNISIVNGEPAAECAWRWQVGLKSSPWSVTPWCGGMLIAPDWVLTAAHCLTGEAQNGIYVIAGEWDVRSKSGNEQVKRSTKWIDHPRYISHWNNDFDIGLIKLESPMEMNGCVGTVCLPSSAENDVVPGSQCWITGWGTLSSGGKQPSILQEASVSVMSNEECKRTGYSSFAEYQILDSMVCAQGRTRDGRITDACQGDSGGPLVCESEGIWTVYGATSWGRGCAGARFPGVWSRVTESLDWIHEVMESN